MSTCLTAPQSGDWFVQHGATDQVSRGALIRHYRIIQELAKRIPEGTNGLLGVGCGEGTTIRVLEKYGYVMWGIDPRDNSGRVKRFRLAKGEAIPFPDKAFDFVVLSHVFAHVQHVNKFLEEVARVLCPHGSALVIQTNRFSWERLLGHYIVGSGCDYHLRTVQKIPVPVATAWRRSATHNTLPLRVGLGYSRVPFLHFSLPSSGCR